MSDYNDDDEVPQDFAQYLRDFIESQGGLDTEALAKVAGIPNDPETIKKLLGQMASAMTNAEPLAGAVNWELAEKQARSTARTGGTAISTKQRDEIDNALRIAALWLDDATVIPAVNSDPKLLTRELWVADALPLFKQMSTPVATRMAEALSKNMQANLPENMGQLSDQMGRFLQNAAAAMFAMQLGGALGKLSAEVLSGGDIGLPIFSERAALIPQNLEQFASDFQITGDQSYIFLCIRELAYARLFKNSKWLRDTVVAQITKYASEIDIDVEQLARMAEENNLSDPEEMKKLIESGAFIAERTDAQQVALTAIENLLALVDGWVEYVTVEATKLLPDSRRIAEAVQRRRLDGGPAEKTFGTLVGLQLRPRRIRDAVALWRAVTEQLGVQRRDAIWTHPDLLPTEDELNDPSKLIARLNTDGGDWDGALRDLLDN